MEKKIIIQNQEISENSGCFVIAEIGNNHQGDLALCKEMFKVAKECGATAVKLQKRDNKALFTKEMYNKPYDNENSYGDTYGQHREYLEFGKSEYLELKKYAEELDIIFFATAFDIPSADFLQELDMPAFKIASGDIRNIPMMKHIARFNKPMFISTGACQFEDVKRAYEAIIPINDQLVIFQCTAGYPAKYEELDLKVIQTYQKEFPEAIIGLSSHDSGIAMAVVAYTLGARVIEKHFTMNRASKGTDHAFSLEPVGLRKMVRDLTRARIAMGNGEKRMFESEIAPGLKMGKSLMASKDLKAGTVLAADDICIKSPAGGMPPFCLNDIIGKKLKKDILEDEMFEQDMVED